MNEKWKPTMSDKQVRALEKEAFIGDKKELGFDQEELKPEGRNDNNKNKKKNVDAAPAQPGITSNDAEDAQIISLKSREEFIKRFLKKQSQMKELDSKFSDSAEKLEKIESLQAELRKIDSDIDIIREHVKILVKRGDEQEEINEGNKFIKALEIKRKNRSEELDELKSLLVRPELLILLTLYPIENYHECVGPK